MKGIILGLLVLSSAVAHGFDYCTLKCHKGRHTMCKHKTEDPAQLCVNYEKHFLSSQEKKEILDKHNELRAQVARGEVPNHPKGLDVKDLAWSEEDELIAKRWALQCTYEHDDCRDTKDGKWAGQNLAISASGSGFKGKHLNQVQGWFDEHKMYKPGKDNLYPKGVDGVGHYTQMVWGKTTHVGCERTYFKYEKGNFAKFPGVEYLVCVYSPGGNWMGEQVYKPGGLVNKLGEQANKPGGQENKPGGQENKPGGQENKPGKQENKPGKQVYKPGEVVNKPGGLVNKPGGQVYKPGGQVDKPGGLVNKPGGQVDKPGGQANKPGGQVDKPGGQVDKPGEVVDKPGGQENKPGGQENKPGGQENKPGGQENKPGKQVDKAVGVKQEGCVFTLLVSLVLALKSNLLTGGL